jgi:TRAP transporter 4TM/12TM fusion protein
VERRKLTGSAAYVVAILSILVSLLIFYTAFKGAFPPLIQRAGFLTLMVPLILLLYPRSKKSPTDRIPFSDIILALAAAISFGWILLDYSRIAYRIPYVSPVTLTDLILGSLAVLFILEVTRRTLGWILVWITATFIAYTFLGPYLSGILSFKQFSYSICIEQFYLVPEGMFNIMTGLAATYVFTFVAFGTFLRVSRADRYYIDISLALAGRSRGGAAKVAVLSAGLMGMLTGSTMSNVVTTGSLTIPMMKNGGFKAREAAAITTASSTGGAVTPPIMGAGVFVMSAITGIPLLTIIKFSIIPAIIYFASIYAIIEIKARKYGLEGLPKDKLPPVKEAVKRGIHLFFPLLILIILLAIGRTPFVASAVSTILIVVFSWMRKDTRMGPQKIIQGLQESAQNMMTITSVCACAAVIMGVITLTGLIMKVTSIILVVSGGSVLFALFLLAFISLVIGMGMPVTLSYILISTLGAPALTQLGVTLLAAHLALFWFSQTSTITPPVCMTAFVAAEIAQDKQFMRVGLSTFTIAKFFYVIPLFFVFTPILSEDIIGPARILLQSLPLLIVLAIVTEGFLFSRLKLAEWILIILSSIFFAAAAFAYQYLGIATFTVLGLLSAGAVFALQKRRKKTAGMNVQEQAV